MASYVYFIQAKNGPIKIGFSKNLEFRIKAIQQCCPYKLELLACFVGSGYDERFIHRTFSKERIHGEWFKSSKKLKSFIKEIAEENRFDSETLYQKGGLGFPIKHPKNMNKSELLKLSSEHKRKTIESHYNISESSLVTIITKHGLKRPNKPKNLSSKLVQQICNEYASGKWTQQKLAKKHNLSQGTVSKIINKEIHKSCGLHLGGDGKARLNIGYKHGY